MAKKKWLKPLLWTCVVVVIIAAIVIPIAIVFSQPGEDSPAKFISRIECFPLDPNVNKTFCESKDCLWDGQESAQIKCYLPTGVDSYGYKISDAQENTTDGFKIKLQRQRQTNGESPSLYGGDYDDVEFHWQQISDTMASFKFVPVGVSPPRYPLTYNLPSEKVKDPLYEIRLLNTQNGLPFSFQILRKSSQTVLFDTSIGGLTIAEQFLMISTKLPTDNLYGIGENTHASFKHDMNYRMWPIFPRDQPPGDGEMNLYGSQPFYMVSEDDGSSHGVLFLNTHSIDVTTLPEPGLTYRTIGGLLEFYMFFGPSPEEVVQQYTYFIGRPVMPPYWALGFQLSRYGYKDADDIAQVVNRTTSANIPLDVQYADIDHMDEQADFTLGSNFTKLPDYVRQFKQDGIHFIIILDPAINTEKDNYPVHDRAMEKDVYIKWNTSLYTPKPNCTVDPSDCQPLGDVMLGYVWPVGRTGFPDFFKNITREWWTEEIVNFYSQLEFDGLWIDMNEPANFDTNQKKPWNWPPDQPDWNLHCPENKWDDPPYITLSAKRSSTQRLSDKTICMIGLQGNDNEYRHYEVHNLYGYTQTMATYHALEQLFTDNRSIIITRSTFAGSGKYSGHWLGDNTARWEDMHRSIIGMLEFNLFGVPYIGADICGFFLNTTEKLCQRWMELGAFYPFARNHNTIKTIDQDPGMWDSVADASRKALNIRYRLLPYLYTLFFHSHVKGSTVVRPLHHEFPTDKTAKGVDQQFLWGPALLISPVLKEDDINLTAYLPNTTWYNYHTGRKEPNVGEWVIWATPLDQINLHVRGGYILPQQKEALNTIESRQNNFSLVVALDENGAAQGDLFWDDGEGRNTIEKGLYEHLNFVFKTNTNNSSLEMTYAHTSSKLGLFLDTVYVLGMQQKPTTIKWGNETFQENQIVYNNDIKSLTLNNFALSLEEPWTIDFIY